MCDKRVLERVLILGVRKVSLDRGINCDVAGALLIPQGVLEPVCPLRVVQN